jgi:hypothetical protein
VAERDIQHDIRLAVGSLPGVALWRNSVGAAKGADGRWSRYGLCTGSADLIGIVAPHGRFLALEIKGPHGRATAEQVMFLALVERMGGVGEVVRSVEEATAAVARARSPAASPAPERRG